MAVPDQASRAILGPLLGVPIEERLDLRLERRGVPPTRPLPRDPGERVVHRAGLAQRDDAGIFDQVVSLPLGRPGRLRHPSRRTAFPTPIIEFRAQLRDELPNGEIFYSLAEAKIAIESGRQHDNSKRPRSSPRYRSPDPEFAP
jgi:hypothetical protein